MRRTKLRNPSSSRLGLSPTSLKMSCPQLYRPDLGPVEPPRSRNRQSMIALGQQTDLDLSWLQGDWSLWCFKPSQLKPWNHLHGVTRTATSSKMRIPRDQQSAPKSWPLFNTTSGATYSGVPQNVHVFLPRPIFLAKPKSAWQETGTKM
ncbi:hypothetical protein CRUP_015526 [Coryphaenoides rupestris]|nr:hypothetical protein CRUP_015526 [Coryphaenoides rupestris]